MTLLEFQNSLGKEFELQPDDFVQIIDDWSLDWVYLNGDKVVNQHGDSYYKSIDEVFGAEIDDIRINNISHKLEIYINW